MITTIIFDFGGVLFSNGTRLFITSLASRYSLPEEEVRDVIDGKIGSDYREAKISRDEFWRQTISLLHLKETPDALEKEWIDGYQLIGGTMELVKELSKKYALYYLSDNVRERIEALDKKYDFIRLFKGGIFSHKVGVRKPHPQIYQFAMQLSRSSPKETLYIDDKPAFLLPARQLGLKTLVFTTPEQLKVDLVQERIL